MRTGVIGLGFMGTTHMKAWMKVSRAEIVAVCSNDPKKLSGDLSDIQGNLGGPGEKFDFSAMRKYRTVPEILADTDVEAVDICLPTNLHAPTALAALRAGKHVLVEKPMSLTAEESDGMVAAAAKAGKILMAGQVLRFFPEYRAVADAVASGKYGATRSVLFRRRCAAPSWSKWLADPGVSGGGVFDLLIHDIDFALHMFGTPEAVSATGYEDLPEGIDSLHATLFYTDGLTVLITGGWHHKKAYPFSMEYTVVTDGATFEFDSRKGEGVTAYNADGESSPLLIPSQDGFEAELQYFTDCVEDGKAPALCPPEESAAAVRLALRLLESRKHGGERLSAAA